MVLFGECVSSQHHTLDVVTLHLETAITMGDGSGVRGHSSRIAAV